MAEQNIQDSYNTLVAKVHAPVFFGKLAHVYNIQPNSEEEAHEYLRMAGKLRNIVEVNRIKTAGERKNVVASANDKLDAILNSYGVGNSDNAAFEEQLKKSASEAINIPGVKEAANAYSEYLREQFTNT